MALAISTLLLSPTLLSAIHLCAMCSYFEQRKQEKIKLLCKMHLSECFFSSRQLQRTFAFNNQAQTATNKNNSTSLWRNPGQQVDKKKNHTARCSIIMAKVGLLKHVINYQPLRKPLLLYISLYCV